MTYLQPITDFVTPSPIIQVPNLPYPERNATTPLMASSPQFEIRPANPVRIERLRMILWRFLLIALPMAVASLVLYITEHAVWYLAPLSIFFGLLGSIVVLLMKIHDAKRISATSQIRSVVNVTVCMGSSPPILEINIR